VFAVDLGEEGVAACVAFGEWYWCAEGFVGGEECGYVWCFGGESFVEEGEAVY